MSQIKSICHATRKLLQHPPYQVLCSVVVVVEMSCGKFCAQFSSCLVLTPQYFGDTRFLTPAAVRKTQESGRIDLIFWYTNDTNQKTVSITH